MKIEWTKRAVKRLEKEIAFISKENPIAANKVSAIILMCVDKLEDMPNLGRPGRVQKTRELIILNLPYIVLYRIQNNTIQIIRLFHTSRKWIE